MGSNVFSDMLKPVSDYIESIPVIGDVIKFADKAALNSDPSQLGTSLIGKLIGGNFADTYTSEEARKGASHNIGLAALAYVLGGGGAAAGEGASVGTGTGEAAVGTGEVAGAGAVGAEATPELAPLSSYALGGGELSTTGTVGAGVTASGEIAPLSSFTFGAKEASLTDKLLTVKNANNLLRIAKILNPSKKTPVGSSSTAASGKQVDPNSTSINKLMENALGPDQSSLMFDNKGMTLKNSDQNVLYKSFLSGDNKNPLTSMGSGGSLSLKPIIKAKKIKSNKGQYINNEFSSMKDTSIINPFTESNLRRL